ncbi:MAG: protein DA1 [Chloroflexi bacterium]|nr:protein DA1 [Chloroflexota bacterium]
MCRHSIDDIRCDNCASIAIENAPQARLLMQNLIAWMEAQGVRFHQKTFRLEILDRTEFMSREGGRCDPLGLTTSTRFMRQQRVDHAKIESVAILQRLPHLLFEGVCIHELGHVWLVQHHIVNLPIVEEEGFCEWLAHRHYMEIRSKVDLFYAQHIVASDDPLYGDGFRKLKRLEERVGFAQIIKSPLRKKKLP